MSGEANFNNSGVMQGVVVGGHGNRAVWTSSDPGIDMGQLAAEIDRVLESAKALPLDPKGLSDVKALQEAAEEVRRGDPSAARKRLASVGDWVKAMSAALTANVLVTFLPPS